MTPSVIRGWLVLIVAGAGILGSVGLGRPSFWVDEVHSYEFAALPSFGLVALNAAARDAYPPLYFLLLHGWMSLGSSEVWLRGFSLLCHLGTIPPVYLLGRRLAGPGTGLTAAALLAFNPFHLAFAREVRMYSLVGLLAVASMWGVAAWIKDASLRGRRAVLWLGIAMLYTHFICALLLLAHWIALRFGHVRRGWAKGTGRWVFWTCVAFLPWSPLFLKSLAVTGGYGAEAFVTSLAYWFVSALGAGFAKPGGLLISGAAVILAGVALGLIRAPSGTPRRLLALWAFLPPALELCSAALGKPVFGERTLIVSTPAWLILIAVGIVWSKGVMRWAPAAAVAATMTASHVHEFRVNLPEAPAHREALAVVAGASRAGDVVVHSATVTYHAAHEYYLPRLGGAAPADFIIEPRGVFRAGRLGTLFRDVWRRVRERLDPAGRIRTGTDPSRIPEDEFLARRPARIFFLRTDEDGARRLWRLIPSAYYARSAAKVFTRSMADTPRIAHVYRLDRVLDRRPGLSVEVWVLR